MNKQLINNISVLKEMMDYMKPFKEYDFDDHSAAELEETFTVLDMLANQADDTHYAIACFRDMVDGLRVERAHEESEADYESDREHRAYLNNYWHSQRM